MKGVFSAPGDYIHFKSQVPLHKIPVLSPFQSRVPILYAEFRFLIGTKQWRYYDFGSKSGPSTYLSSWDGRNCRCLLQQIMSLSIKVFDKTLTLPDPKESVCLCSSSCPLYGILGSSKWRILLWNLSIPISYIARHYERGDLQGLEIGGDGVSMVILSPSEGYRVISVDIPRVWNHHEWIQAFEKFLDAIDVHHCQLDPFFFAEEICLNRNSRWPHEPFIADSVDFVVSQVETLSREDLASRLTLTVDAASIGPLLLSDSFITLMDVCYSKLSLMCVNS
ncbi:hypothetical protein CK203_073333 [Vitis vinifera]|uniref:Uncharacterized protein n=1 Tax=Vitis vinifera TaxID=29760 RepID=A0A438ESG7_VITVI|nr:hypothetical protein CK203_073333 [Vitis vinifera]